MRNIPSHELNGDRDYLKERSPYPEPAHPKSADEARRLVQIIFDGGCIFEKESNGVGRGYGSYRIDEEKIVRVDHGLNMTANAAEVLTVCRALEEIIRRLGVETTNLALLIIGDSQVALANVRRFQKPNAQPKKGTHESFQYATESLGVFLGRFTKIEARWHGRKNSVKLFGH